MPITKRMTPNTAYKSIRWLADRIYEFDKRYNFKLPTTKNKLTRYAEELRFLVDEALKMSKVPMMKIIEEEKINGKEKEE